MKKLFISIVLILTITGMAKAQSEYQPYSYQFYQKFNTDIYSILTREHTSLKPYFVDDSLLFSYSCSIIVESHLRNVLKNQHLFL